MKNNKTKIIAEIGWNHMGNIKLAEKMIVSASKSGADICKFQSWKVSNLKAGPWDTDGRRDIYKKAELKNSDYKKLITICKKNKVEFLTSVFNLKELNFVKELKLESIKIPSHEIYNYKLIKEAIKNFKIIYISAGAARFSELKKVFLLLKKSKKKIFLMHCVSSYPLDVGNVNLPKLEYFKKITKNIGYSGHTKSIDDAIAALSIGCQVIEKHFTIDNSLPGRDNLNAILPEEMKKISLFRDNLIKMRIDRGLDLQQCERDIFNNYRGRWAKK